MVQPVSLLHSHKVAAELLGGRPATILIRALRAAAKVGKRRFIILPLFLGPSRAIIDYVPEVVGEVQRDYPDLVVQLAEPLAGEDVEAPDPRLAELLAIAVERVLEPGMRSSAKVALVDHAAPLCAGKHLAQCGGDTVG